MSRFKVEGEKERYDVYKVDSRGPYTVTKGELALPASLIEAAAEAREVRTVPHFITLAVILAANEEI